MNEQRFLLFGQERWALAQHSVVRVESLEEREGENPPLSLSTWGLDDFKDEIGAHVLRVETPAHELALIVYGQLRPLQVEPKKVVELPQKFFKDSPATALIILAENQLPALLLDPGRLRTESCYSD